MTIYITAVSLLITLTFAAMPVWAMPSFFGGRLATPGTERRLVLPPQADNSPVIYLGTADDPTTGEIADGYAIIHRRKGNAKPIVNAAKSNSTNCYGFLIRGAKWRTVEPWLANGANNRGLLSDAVFNALTNGIDKWEDAADGIIGNGSGVDILGVGSSTSAVLAADTSAPDGQNEVYFADIADSNAIAVTIVWYNRFTKSLLEWDQVYDDTTFDWSLAGEAGKMDYDNIATHELGHSVGLGDLYNSCTEETMYGYADYGEIKKRDLHAGDIAGANRLY